MGCAPSLLDEESQPSKDNELKQEFSFDPKNPESLLSTYIEIDKEIVHLENASPAPMFGRAIASSRKLRVLLDEYDDGYGIIIMRRNFITSIPPPPGPTPTFHFLTRYPKLISKFDLHLTKRTNDNPNFELTFVDALSEKCFRKPDEDSDDVEKLFLELGLSKSPNVAAEHEEFIANSNRKALDRNRVNILRKALYVSDKKLQSCSKKVNLLQNLYQQQEALLMSVFGAAYGSEKERLIEQETDTMRNFRDTLALGVLQWEDSVDDLQSAGETAQRALISWKSLKKQPIDRKLKLTAETRNNLQESVFLVQRTQETLQEVQFPYCSARELSAVLQAIEYIFTDILIEERYNHALKVYENFSQRITALRKWMVKTLAESLRKDLLEFDEKVIKVNKRLREERVQQICTKLKIPNSTRKNSRLGSKAEPSVYQRPMEPEIRYKRENRYGDVLASPKGDLASLGPTLGISDSPGRIFTDPNLQRDFEDKLAARRSAMWPSRRMEELRQLALRDTSI